jgi:transposase
MTNKYVHRSRISESKFRELVRLFALDLTATQIAELAGLNRNTVNRYLTGIRERLAEYCKARAPFPYQHDLEASEEVDQLCAGIAEKERRVYTVLLNKASVIENEGFVQLNTTLQMNLDMIIDAENHHLWQADSLNRQGKHIKMKRINGFWGYLTTRLEKFKGIHLQTCLLHLKESEFRYNNEKERLYQLVLKIVRTNPLF